MREGFRGPWAPKVKRCCSIPSGLLPFHKEGLYPAACMGKGLPHFDSELVPHSASYPGRNQEQRYRALHLTVYLVLAAWLPEHRRGPHLYLSLLGQSTFVLWWQPHLGSLNVHVNILPPSSGNACSREKGKTIPSQSPRHYRAGAGRFFFSLVGPLSQAQEGEVGEGSLFHYIQDRIGESSFLLKLETCVCLSLSNNPPHTLPYFLS